MPYHTMDNSASVRLSVRPPACLSRRSISGACRSLGAGSRYRLTATGARAAAEGSVMPRAEVRGSTQTCSLVSARRKRLLNTNLPIRRVIFLETFRRAAGACLPIASLPKRTLFFSIKMISLLLSPPLSQTRPCNVPRHVTARYKSSFYYYYY